MKVSNANIESVIACLTHDVAAHGATETSLSCGRRYSLTAKVTKRGVSIRAVDPKTRDPLPFELKDKAKM